MAICIILIHQTWYRWMTSPVIITMDERLRPVWKIPFPAVTICPLARIDVDKFNLTEAILNYVNLTDEQKDTVATVMLHCPTILPLTSKSTIRNLEAMKLLEQIAIPIEKWLDTARFRDPYRNFNFFAPIMTESGLCYTTNILPNEEFFPNNTFHSSRDYVKFPIKATWKLGEEYPPDSGFSSYPFRALASGKRAGLTLLLFTEDKQWDIFCTQSIKGFEVVLHNPAQFPIVYDQAFMVPLESSVHVAVTPQETLTANELRRYSPVQRQCFYSDERQLAFFKHYTRQNCEMECLVNMTLHFCGCVAFYMPRAVDTDVCEIKHEYCLYFARTLFERIQADMYKENEFGNLSAEQHKNILAGREIYAACNCLQSCSALSYATERSSSNSDHEGVIKFILAMNGDKMVHESRKYTELIVYYKESHYIPTRRMELYGLASFIANCGGVLGLCLGLSLLSVLEILFWFLVRPLWRLRKGDRRTLIAGLPGRRNQVLRHF